MDSGRFSFSRVAVSLPRESKLCSLQKDLGLKRKRLKRKVGKGAASSANLASRRTAQPAPLLLPTTTSAAGSVLLNMDQFPLLRKWLGQIIKMYCQPGEHTQRTHGHHSCIMGHYHLSFDSTHQRAPCLACRWHDCGVRTLQEACDLWRMDHPAYLQAAMGPA
jgi:hypothetical protein